MFFVPGGLPILRESTTISLAALVRSPLGKEQCSLSGALERSQLSGYLDWSTQKNLAQRCQLYLTWTPSLSNL